MRTLLVLATVLVATPSLAFGGVVTGGGGSSIRGARDILGCADVRAFGAVGNGVADDTAAIQAAIDSFAGDGGPVCLPRGTFKVTSTLNAKKATSFFGAGMGFTNSAGTVVSASTTIDGSAITNAAVIDYPGNAAGFTLRDFAILGAPSGYTIANRVIDLTSANEALVEHVQIIKGWIGIYTEVALKITFVAVNAELQACAGLFINQSSAISVFGGQFSNSSGQSAAFGLTGNVVLQNASDVNFYQAVFDESFGAASKSVFVLGGSNIRFFGGHIYYSHAGYGMRLGDGTYNPTGVVLSDMKIERFSAGAAPLAGLQLYGSGHVLRNVTVDTAADSGATALSDLATGTKMYGVTSIASGGTTYVAAQDPGMPTVYPGSGSKQFWIDPSDALSTTYLRFAR